MKISKTLLKTIINEEIKKMEIEEGFMDFFKGKKEPEPEPEMMQMDMFPGQGYGKNPHNAAIASMAFDIIISKMPKEKKAAELSKLIDKVKGDGALRSRIMQAVNYVGAEGGDEMGSYDAQLGRAVAMRK
jgi:hypothetical protein